MRKIIYGLSCPFTKEIHYIGLSKKGMVRPESHMTKSHSKKIREWVSDLNNIGHKPNIVILENVSEFSNIENREYYYIQKFLNQGNILLNSSKTKPEEIKESIKHITNGGSDISDIPKFLKSKRKASGLTQQQLSGMSCVSLKVIRKIEQYKTNYQMTGLLTLLMFFGHTITVKINK